jgi:hypothetical protein
MPKPDDPLAYDPEALDRARIAGSLPLKRMMYDRESREELLKIWNTPLATGGPDKN